MGDLKKRLAERDAAPTQDKGHAKAIEEAANHLRKVMRKFSNWQNPCLDKKRKPANFDQHAWDEAERLVREYGTSETSLWDKIKDKLDNPPNSPDVWWDGDPFNPWTDLWGWPSPKPSRWPAGN